MVQREDKAQRWAANSETLWLLEEALHITLSLHFYIQLQECDKTFICNGMKTSE